MKSAMNISMGRGPKSWARPPAALWEFGLLGVLPARPGRVLAHLLLSVWSHCPWRCSSRFHDASCLYSDQRAQWATGRVSSYERANTVDTFTPHHLMGHLLARVFRQQVRFSKSPRPGRMGLLVRKRDVRARQGSGW